jgi:hypothetical protein
VSRSEERPRCTQDVNAPGDPGPPGYHPAPRPATCRPRRSGQRHRGRRRRRTGQHTIMHKRGKPAEHRPACAHARNKRSKTHAMRGRMRNQRGCWGVRVGPLQHELKGEVGSRSAGHCQQRRWPHLVRTLQESQEGGHRGHEALCDLGLEDVGAGALQGGRGRGWALGGGAKRRTRAACTTFPNQSSHTPRSSLPPTGTRQPRHRFELRNNRYTVKCQSTRREVGDAGRRAWWGKRGVFVTGTSGGRRESRRCTENARSQRPRVPSTQQAPPAPAHARASSRNKQTGAGDPHTGVPPLAPQPHPLP